MIDIPFYESEGTGKFIEICNDTALPYIVFCGCDDHDSIPFVSKSYICYTPTYARLSRHCMQIYRQNFVFYLTCSPKCDIFYKSVGCFGEGKVMIYEQRHSLSTNYFSFEKQIDLDFPLHMHHCFEIIAVTSGQMTVQIDAKEHILKTGDVIFVFPYQIHSIKTKDHSEDTLCVFSGSVASLFAHDYSGKVPEAPVVHLGGDPVFSMFTCCTDREEIMSLKGIIYLLFSKLIAATTFKDSDQKSDSHIKLFNDIFAYINQHYRDDCSLYTVAGELKYDYTYLSKIFSEFVGVSCHEYITSLRISEACHLLKNTSNTVIDISEECGFSSLRTFNRNFIKMMDMTPTEYRNRQINTAD